MKQPCTILSDKSKGLANMTVPKVLYKYRSWSEPNHRRLITHNEIFFASPRRFNDPFDCRVMTVVEGSKEQMKQYFDGLIKKYSPDINREQRKKEVRERVRNHVKTRNDPEKREKYEDSLREHTFNYFGIFSMSACNDNILLWSHYSDSHKGICVGIDTTILHKYIMKNRVLLTKQRLVSLFQVKYQEEYPDISIIKRTTSDPDMLNDSLKIKSTDWKYEQEYRLVLTNGTDYPLKIPQEATTSVYLGLFISREHREQILEELRKRQTKPMVYQATRKRKAFGLEFSEVQY